MYGHVSGKVLRRMYHAPGHVNQVTSDTACVRSCKEKGTVFRDAATWLHADLYEDRRRKKYFLSNLQQYLLDVHCTIEKVVSSR